MQPIGSAKRWIKGKGKQDIQQPAVIASYKRGMGGFDLLDSALSDLRPVIHGEMWYWLLVINAISIACVCSCRLYRIVSGETIPQKDFRRHIVATMIRQSKPHVISIDFRPAKAHKVANEVRYDGLGPYPISCSVLKCAVCGKCYENSCESSKRSLHFKTCFQFFHEKWQYNDIITTTCIMFII